MSEYAPVSCSAEHVQASIKSKDNLLYNKSGTLTSAQLLALNATPVSLVPAPGANKANIFEGMTLFYDYGTTVYTVTSDKEISVKYTDGSGLQVANTETEGFIDQATDQYRYVPLQLVAGYAPVANAALVAHMTTGEVTAGNGVVYYRIFYRIVQLNLNGQP